MPPLIGWAAASGKLDFQAWTLYAILFLWQFPHFMAIAWMYREDYARTGYLVLPPDGSARARSVNLQTVLPLLVLVPLSLLPGLMGEAKLYFIAALLLGAGFVFCAARFALRRSICRSTPSCRVHHLSSRAIRGDAACARLEKQSYGQ